jgi:uncharacterized protein (DUF779 family)
MSPDPERQEGPQAGRPGEPSASPSRVDLTGEAADLLRRLTVLHGPLMFHQSGGCCAGSSPMCFPADDFLTSEADVHLADLVVEGIEAPVGFWMSVPQYAYWKHTHLTVDVVTGRGSGFSVEAPEGVRFLIRSRLFTDAESAALGIERPRLLLD